MDRTILILTEPGDVHAYAVAEAVRLKGGLPIIWHTTDFPSEASESILFEGSKRSIRISGPELMLDIGDMDMSSLTVWHRRPASVVKATSLHPADVQFAEMECIVFRRSLLTVLSQEAFWVNPPDAAACASRKLVQQQAAAEVGLRMPETLYSNEPEEIRSFIRRHGNTIVYKPFKGLPWRSEETYWVPYTSLLKEDQLVPDHILRSTPGIYQELVPKAFELRVTVMGHHCPAAKILSQDTVDGKVDWRKAYAELEMQPCEIPAAVEELCCKLLCRLGLVFGCFDFIVTPDGDLVFLEVNEMGQFLFVEKYARTPLLDAFSDFLLQGREDFVWHESAKCISYFDVLPQVEEMVSHSRHKHVASVAQNYREDR